MLSIQQVVFDVKSVRLGKMDHVQTAMGMVKTLIPEFKKALCFTGYLSRGNLWFNCLTIQGEMTFDHGTYALEKPAERLFLEHFYRSNATLSGSFKKKQKRM